MKLLLVIILYFPLTVYGQNDSLKLFKNNSWRANISSDWASSDTVVLEKNEKSNFNFGEQLKLDKTNNLVYEYNIGCPVGERWPQMEDIKFKNGRLTMKYRIYSWEIQDENQVPFNPMTYMQWFLQLAKTGGLVIPMTFCSK